MSALEMCLQEIGLLSIVKEKAKEFGLSIEQVLEKGVKGLQSSRDDKWEEWRRGAEELAGREVTSGEILLFGRFGHINLSQVSDAELDELEVDIDAGRF